MPVDYSAALANMVALSRKGGLNDRSVNGFAVKREYVDVVAALSFLSGTPVEVMGLDQNRRTGRTNGGV